MDEYKERTKLYNETNAKLVINRLDGQHINLYKELELLRRDYNKHNFNLQDLANQHNVQKQIIKRERFLCDLILEKYLK